MAINITSCKKLAAALACYPTWPVTQFLPVRRRCAPKSTGSNTGYLQTWEPLFSFHIFIWSVVLSLFSAMSKGRRDWTFKLRKQLKRCCGEKRYLLNIMPAKKKTSWTLADTPRPLALHSSDWLVGGSWPTSCYPPVTVCPRTRYLVNQSDLHINLTLKTRGKKSAKRQTRGQGIKDEPHFILNGIHTIHYSWGTFTSSAK